MTITVQVERWRDAIPEIVPLLAENFAESGRPEALPPLDPDYDLYYRLDAKESLLTATIRDDGVLVGYIITLIAGDIHARGVKFATTDTIYVRPAYQRRVDLVGFAADRLKELGVKRFVLGGRGTPAFARLMRRRGFYPAEVIYERIL